MRIGFFEIGQWATHEHSIAYGRGIQDADLTEMGRNRSLTPAKPCKKD
jgi:hypothetical protein